MHIPAFLMAATLGLADPLPDLDSLSRVVTGLQSEMKDLEFAFEGTFKTLANHEGEQPPQWNFQGQFAYREDTSIYMNVYREYADPNQSIKRMVWGYLYRTSTLESFDSRIDSEKPPTTPVRTKTGMPLLEREDAPLRFWLTPLFLCLLRDTSGYRSLNGLSYECLGWEKLGDIACLKLKFATEAGKNGYPTEELIYWVDMNRGGTPIRRDNYNQGKLWSRTESTKLSRERISGDKAYWLPLEGTFLSYLTGDFTKDGRMETADRPVVEQNFVVLNNTLRINQDLADDKFTARWQVGDERGTLKAMRADFERDQARIKKSTARKRLDESLQDAKEQKVLLEASAPSRERISSTTSGMLLFGSAGIVLIMAYLFLKRTAR